MLEGIWLLERELGNVREVLRDFEARNARCSGEADREARHISMLVLGCRNDGISHLRDIGEDGRRMATEFAPAYNEVHGWQDALQLTEQVVETSKRSLGEEHSNTWIHRLVTLNRMLKKKRRKHIHLWSFSAAR